MISRSIIEAMVRFEVAPETMPADDAALFRDFSKEAKRQLATNEGRISLMVGLSRDVNPPSACQGAMSERDLACVYIDYLDGKKTIQELRNALRALI